jgi:UDP-glucose 4-epimerase
MSRVVLVTGVSRDLGSRFARALATSSGHTVIGFDAVSPRRDLGPVRFVRGDVRSPSFQGVLTQNEVDTLVHCGLVEADLATSPAVAKEHNLLMAMQLVAACQQAPRLRRLVVRSTGQVYGTSPLDPVRFAEDTAPRRAPRGGVGRDAGELEMLVGRLPQRRPDLTVTVLRLANLMGSGVDTSLTRWLNLPVVPRPLGFNARLQFLHPADAVDVLLLAVEQEMPGTFNVAAEDAVTLTQVVRILGRPTIGVWRQTPGLLALARRRRIVQFTADDVRDITWGRLLDTRRITAAGFTPHYSSRRAVEEFAALGQPGLLSAERVEGVLDGVARILSPRPAPRRSESPRP